MYADTASLNSKPHIPKNKGADVAGQNHDTPTNTVCTISGLSGSPSLGPANSAQQLALPYHTISMCPCIVLCMFLPTHLHASSSWPSSVLWA